VDKVELSVLVPILLYIHNKPFLFKKRVIKDTRRGEMEEYMEEDQCGRCHKKSAVLISYSSLYDTDICKTCFLKLKLQSKTLSGQGSRSSYTDGISRSIRRVV